MMKKYDDFKNELKNGLEKQLGGQATVQIEETERNNQTLKEVLCFSKKGEGIVIKSEIMKLYGRYQVYGGNLEKLIRDLVSVLEEKPRRTNQLGTGSWEEVKSKLVIRLVNRKWNAKYISKIPHFDLLDLTATFQIVLEQPEFHNMACIVTNEMLQEWQITEDDLKKAGLDNLRESDFTASDIRKLIWGDMESCLGLNEVESDSLMNVIKNHRTGCGADVLLMPEILQNYAEQAGDNLFILPCSIYEVIVITENGWGNVTELQMMVHEINQTQVAREEWLSHSVYYYRRDSGKVELGTDVKGVGKIA